MLLSIIEDLVHWPLPSQCPAANAHSFTAADDCGAEAVDVDALWRDDALLTAKDVEGVNDEPRERQRSRYNAVRRLPALVRALGLEWANAEIIPYMLRCIEEDDAELCFATCVALIDIATSPQCRRGTDVLTDSSAVHPFSLEAISPVVVRMAAISDAGVRRFLADVVIPTLFFGVSLENSIDLRDWEVKYLGVRCNGANDMSADGETEVTFGVNGKDSGTIETNAQQTAKGISAVSGSEAAVWDIFEINLYANRLRSAIAAYLYDLNTNGGSVAEESSTLPTSCGKTAAVLPDYTGSNTLREALCARWSLFLSLIGTLLKSGYAAAVSVAVACIGNVFSCLTWVKLMEQGLKTLPLSLSSALSLRSIEELMKFIFIATRTHVGRAVCSSAKNPCEDLLMVLFNNNLLLKKDNSLPFGAGDFSLNIIKLGYGGYSAAQREFWDLLLGCCAPTMHRVVRMNIFRSLPQLIDMVKGNIFQKATVESSELNGLTFASVCDIFTQALTTQLFSNQIPVKEESKNNDKNGKKGGERRNGKEDNGKEKTAIEENKKKEAESAVSVEVFLQLENDISRDFGVAEALFDGVQQILENLLRPHTMEALLSKTGEHATCPTFEEKKTGLMRLCALYHDCVVYLARLPLWKTRWLATQRIPKLTVAFLGLLRSVADCDADDGPALVETCAGFLFRLHTEQWSLSPTTLSSSSSSSPSPSSSSSSSFLFSQGCSSKGCVGSFGELVRDAEEEVRCVVAVCAASIFRDLGQSMFCFVFPHGVVTDMHKSNQANFPAAGTAAESGNQVNESSENAISDNSDSSPVCNSLLSVNVVVKSLTALFEVIFSCCVTLLHDAEERVRSGAAAGLSELARTLSVMAASCDLHLVDLGKETWLRYLNNTTTSLMSLLADKSPTVQIALVTELTALLEGGATGPGRFAAAMGGDGGNVTAAQVREETLVECLKNLSRHGVWRYRERFAKLLSEMCVRFLLPNSFFASLGGFSTSTQPPQQQQQQQQQLPPLELALSLLPSCKMGNSPKKGSFSGGRTALVDAGGEASVYRLRRFVHKELLPLFVDVLFDKVKAVRDGALRAIEKMCMRLCETRVRVKADFPSDVASEKVYNVKRGSRSGKSNTSHYYNKTKQNNSSVDHFHGHCQQYDNNSFINETLWPLIINSPKAMATYLSRSSLLRIAVCLGVDKKSILFPLLNYLSHDAVLNVRLVVAKELFGILSSSSAADGNSRVVFSEEEKNGVVLRLLRLLVEDQSADVRDEAAKALKICF